MESENRSESMSSKPANFRISGRYRALVIFITVFVVSIISVLSLNFYISVQFESDASAINLAGRQRMLSQRTVKSLLNIQKAEQSGGDVQAALDELDATYRLFDSTLTAFDAGGSATSATGEPINLSSVRIADGRAAIDTATELWVGYREAILPLLEADPAALEALSDATRAVLDTNESLLSVMNELTTALENTDLPASYVNLAGRQRMLSQRMAKALFEVELAQFDNTDIREPLTELGDTAELFDSTLQALYAGGTAIAGNGQPVRLVAVESGEARQLIIQALSIWEPLREQISQVVNSDSTTLQNLGEAIAVATGNNLEMLRLMNNLTVALENDSSRRSAILRLIQVVGIALALLMFGVIVFYFLRQLRSRDAELDIAKAETDQILATVNDGLFLMDKDFTIGSQHSQSVTEILDKPKLAGENFLSILRKIVPEKTLKTAEDYIELLYGERVNEQLVTDLNPLDEVEVHFESGAGDHRVKYLEFSFKRAKVDGQISHLLVQVDDISQRVKLASELKESQEKAQQQFDLMLKVLHVEPQQLGEFLNGTEALLGSINDTLRERSVGPNQNKNKLDQIFRVMHTIKGDAASLELDAFVDRAHEFENLLDNLRTNDELVGSDFLPLAIRLDEFMSQIDSLRALIHRLTDLKQAVQRDSDPMDEPAVEQLDQMAVETVVDPQAIDNSVTITEIKTTNIEQVLSGLARRISSEQGKQVQFSLDGEQHLPSNYQKPLRDIFTQFLRNSITHGIELPEERQAGGKSASGAISASISRDDNGRTIAVFHDDGRGISVEGIKKAALEKNMVTQEQLDGLNTSQIVGLMFKPGFSTASVIDKNAGRGVGMDVVVATLRELGGKIKVRYKAGKFCEFQLILPEIETDDKELEVANAVTHR